MICRKLTINPYLNELQQQIASFHKSNDILFEHAFLFCVNWCKSDIFCDTNIEIFRTFLFSWEFIDLTYLLSLSMDLSSTQIRPIKRKQEKKKKIRVELFPKYNVNQVEIYYGCKSTKLISLFHVVVFFLLFYFQTQSCGHVYILQTPLICPHLGIEVTNSTETNVIPVENNATGGGSSIWGKNEFQIVKFSEWFNLNAFGSAFSPIIMIFYHFLLA